MTKQPADQAGNGSTPGATEASDAAVQDAVKLLHASGQTFFGAEDLHVLNRNMSFTKDKVFMKLYREMAEDGKEKGRLWRLHIFLWAFINGLRLQGDLIECGVYRGFSSALAVRYTKFERIAKTLYLFDTWEGIPADQLDTGRLQIEKYKDPDNHAKVQARFKDYPNVRIVKGRVPESFDLVELPEKIAFLHLDMNTSIGEVAALDVLFQRMVPGSVCLLDDFGLLIAREQMVSEAKWFRSRGYMVCELPTSQALVIKT
jgi:O-methyltransferase